MICVWGKHKFFCVHEFNADTKKSVNHKKGKRDKPHVFTVYYHSPYLNRMSCGCQCGDGEGDFPARFWMMRNDWLLALPSEWALERKQKRYWKEYFDNVPKSGGWNKKALGSVIIGLLKTKRQEVPKCRTHYTLRFWEIWVRKVSL